MKTFHICYFVDSAEFKLMLTGVSIKAENMMDALSMFLSRGIDIQKIKYITEIDPFGIDTNTEQG